MSITTIEKALAELEDSIKGAGYQCHIETYKMAIAALRAQQEAAKLLPPCYRSDGDGCAYQTYGYDNDEPIDRCKECPLCYSDKVRHYEAEKNEPLTLDELREMPLKEWLWIEIISDCDRAESAYYQVHADYSHGEALCSGYPGLGFGFEYEDYGKTWLAYRHKLKEEV